MPSIIPVLRYDDASKAVKWLCDIFGFTEHSVFRDEKGNVGHAELRLGKSFIMLGPNSPTEFGKFIKQPREVGNIETQICFLSIENIEPFFENCKKLNVEILMPLTKQHYGASDFVCRDFEGHIWSIGDYDPTKK